MNGWNYKKHPLLYVSKKASYHSTRLFIPGICAATCCMNGAFCQIFCTPDVRIIRGNQSSHMWKRYFLFPGKSDYHG